MRAIADTYKYTAFLGSLAGLYVAVDEALAAIFGKNRLVVTKEHKTWSGPIDDQCHPVLVIGQQLSGHVRMRFELRQHVSGEITF